MTTGSSGLRLYTQLVIAFVPLVALYLYLKCNLFLDGTLVWSMSLNCWENERLAACISETAKERIENESQNE